jgi:uncharacterized protein
MKLRGLAFAPYLLAVVTTVWANNSASGEPALWRVHGSPGTAYLFGSIHVLPPNVNWRSPRVDAAIRSANVFVFEIPNDEETQARIARLIAEKGQLPRGMTLPALLPPRSLVDYDADLALAHVPHSAIDGKRPWLADLFLVVQRMAQEKASPTLGVDATLMKEAASRRQEVRYLESIDTQIALLVPNDEKLELDEFEADLKEFRKEKDEFNDLISAWSRGDPSEIDKLINGEFSAHPEARKALLDDRNQAWSKKIESWLLEDKVFFITVGAGHLAGKNSLVQVLRHDGYRIDGP